MDSLRNNDLKGAATILYKLGAVTKTRQLYWGKDSEDSEDGRIKFAADQWNYYWNLRDKVNTENMPQLLRVGSVLPPIMINQTVLDQALRVGRDKKFNRR